MVSAEGLEPSTPRRRKRIAADRARRAKAGARPHAQSAERLMPWIDEGISRSTWYRRRAKIITDETNSRPIDLPSLLKANESHEEFPEACHEASGSATDSEGAHGGEASTITAKPLPSPSFRVHQSSDQAKTDQIAGLDNVAFRAVHHEHYQLLCVMQRSSEQKARLVELNGIIETERERRALLVASRAATEQRLAAAPPSLPTNNLETHRSWT
jgi:hypothetical protein